MSSTQKQIKTSKAGNSEFMVLGKNSEWEPIKSLTIEKNTESTLNSEYILKKDSEYTIKNFLRCTGWSPLEKNSEKRPSIIYLKMSTPCME